MTARHPGRWRRPSKTAIEAAIARAGAGCSMCKQPLAEREARASGYVDGNPQLELAGLCCSDKLSVVWGFDLAPGPHPEPSRVAFMRARWRQQGGHA